MEDSKEVSKEIVKINGKKSLTKKNRKFIQAIIEGKPIHEAYRVAGYRGRGYSAPYELKSYLKSEIRVSMEGHGISEEAILIEARNMLNMPLDPNKIHLTFREKFTGLKDLHKMLPKDAEKERTFSPVIIQRGDGPTQINIGPQETKKEEKAKEATSDAT